MPCPSSPLSSDLRVSPGAAPGVVGLLRTQERNTGYTRSKAFSSYEHLKSRQRVFREKLSEKERQELSLGVCNLFFFLGAWTKWPLKLSQNKVSREWKKQIQVSVRSPTEISDFVRTEQWTLSQVVLRTWTTKGDIFCCLLLLVARTAVITSLVKIFPKLSVGDCAVADSTNEQRKSTLIAPRPAWRRGWGLERRTLRWHPGRSLLSSMVAKTNNISNSHDKILHLWRVYYVSPRQFHIQSLTESPQLSERNHLPWLTRHSWGRAVVEWGRGPHLLSTVTTALPGPGPRFSHSNPWFSHCPSFWPPGLLWLSYKPSGLWKSNLAVGRKGKYCVFPCCLEGGINN